MAFDCFLKIDKVPGECTDEKHAEWIELHSFSHGLAQPHSGSVSSGGGRSAERCNHSDMSVMKSLDKASPKLALACCDGTHFAKVQIELCRASGDKEKYMEYILEDVLVTSYQPSGNSGGSLPMESLTLGYAKITWTYQETDHKTGKNSGNVSAHWDLHKNMGG